MEDDVSARGNLEKLAIFDMDGTLVHFAIDWKGARLEVVKVLRTLAIPESILDIKNSILDIFKNAKEHGIESGRSDIDWEDTRGIIMEIVERYEKEATVISKLVDGIERVLSMLESKGVRMAVCTLNTTMNARFVLEKHEIDSFFDFIAGRDRTNGKFKPNPTHGQIILDHLGIQPRNACMIGDHPADIEMANALHMKAIAVLSDRHGMGDFEQFTHLDFVTLSEYHNLAGKILNALEVL